MNESWWRVYGSEHGADGYDWFCECRGPVEIDVLGECSRCGRITREACERSLGIKAAA